MYIDSCGDCGVRGIVVWSGHSNSNLSSRWGCLYFIAPCNIPRYRYVKYADTWNVHMHRNPETPETLTTLGSSGTKLLLPSWLLGFSTRRERDTISTMLTVPSDPTTRVHPVVHNKTGLAQVQKSASNLNSLPFFQKSRKILSPSLPCMTSFTSPVLFPLWGFYYDICDCYILPARAWTPALNVCPYPWTKSNSSKPN